MRLHWVRYHLDQKKKQNMLLFSVKEPEGIRTYYYDQDEKYVVILEPLRNGNAYYLLVHPKFAVMPYICHIINALRDNLNTYACCKRHIINNYHFIDTNLKAEK